MAPLSAHPLLEKENLSLFHMLFSKEPILLSSEYLLASHFQVCYTLYSQSWLSPVQGPAADRFCLWGMCFFCLHFCFWVPGAVVSLSAFVHVTNGLGSGSVCLACFFFFFLDKLFHIFWNFHKTKLLLPLPPSLQNSKFQLKNAERMTKARQHNLASLMTMDLDRDHQSK